MFKIIMDRIYPKFSKKEFDEQFDLLCKDNPNFGLIEHPPKLTLIQKIKSWIENLK